MHRHLPAVSICSRLTRPCSLVLISLALGFGPTPSLARVQAAGSHKPSQESVVQDSLRRLFEQYRVRNRLIAADQDIAAAQLLAELYERRSFRRVWTDVQRVDQLIHVLRQSTSDGLLPQDYHLPSIHRLRKNAAEDGSALASAHLDLLLSDALVRYVYHLRFGKVDPESLDQDWNFEGDLGPAQPLHFVEKLLTTRSFSQSLNQLRPQQAYYRRMREALADYRKIATKGGWPQTRYPSGLAKGTSGSAVAALQQRLAATGDFRRPNAAPQRAPTNSPAAASQTDLEPSFDDALENALMAFQQRHQLELSGIVDSDTAKALNVPVESRIATLRVNLERARWVLHQLADNFVIVNVAGYQVYYVKNDRIEWSARAQVGRPVRKTPVFRDALRYVVINPDWTVPRGILTKDILPKAKRNWRYLKKKGLKVYTRGGKLVDPKSVTWSRYSAKNFPYIIRQDPGPNNALGRIKFMFPNRHAVYLHDTPDKEKFGESKRALSSGCIRIERPFELAELLLGDKERWNAESFAQLVEQKDSKTLHLESPVPILLLYWSASVDQEGQVQFFEDIYDRDPNILRRLDGPFKVAQRHRQP